MCTQKFAYELYIQVPRTSLHYTEWVRVVDVRGIAIGCVNTHSKDFNCGRVDIHLVGKIETHALRAGNKKRVASHDMLRCNETQKGEDTHTRARARTHTHRERERD